MQLGANGETLIKSFESLALSAYLDQRGIPTIGWGHTGEYTPSVPVQMGQTCTEAMAEAWFQADTASACAAVTRLVTAALNQNQFDALVSFTFNLGAGSLAHSTLLRDLNAGAYRSAADEFLRWDYAGAEVSAGLERRRRAERGLFLQPVMA